MAKRKWLLIAAKGNYSQLMVRAAVAASGVVIAAWVVLIAITDPTADPQNPVAYVFWTVCAVGALLLIWLAVLVVSMIRRFGNRGAKHS